MTTVSAPYTPAFSLDHLLLTGLIIDRGQIPLLRRGELEWRVKGGDLIKEMLFSPARNRIYTVYRLPCVPATSIVPLL